MLIVQGESLIMHTEKKTIYTVNQYSADDKDCSGTPTKEFSVQTSTTTDCLNLVSGNVTWKSLKASSTCAGDTIDVQRYLDVDCTGGEDGSFTAKKSFFTDQTCDDSEKMTSALAVEEQPRCFFSSSSLSEVQRKMIYTVKQYSADNTDCSGTPTKEFSMQTSTTTDCLNLVSGNVTWKSLKASSTCAGDTIDVQRYLDVDC